MYRCEVEFMDVDVPSNTINDFEIINDPALVRWLRRLRRENTKRNYGSILKVFCRFLNLTPSQLKNEAESEQESNVLKSRRKIKDHFEDFEFHLKDQNLSSCTIHAYFTGIKSFYTYYDIDLPNLNLESVAVKACNMDIPTKADIRAILNVCDPLEKAIVLVGCASGLSANEIVNLKVKDLEFDNNTNITSLKLRRQKTNVDFVTFLTPEATVAIKEYIQFRGRTSEDQRKNKALLKQKIYSNNDYLFCVRLVSNEFFKKHDETLRKFSVSGIMSIYRDLSEKVSKSTLKGEFNIIRSHCMRKYFDSVLLNANCDFFHVEYFMGHKLPATQAHYYRANVEELKKMYMSFVPYLTFSSELDISESEEFKKLVEENEILKAQIGSFKAQSEIQIAELKRQIIKELEEEAKFQILLLESKGKISNDSVTE